MFSTPYFLYNLLVISRSMHGTPLYHTDSFSKIINMIHVSRHSYLSSQDQISSTRVVLTPKFSQFVKSTSSDTREECGVNANKGSTAGVYLTSRQFLVITIRMTDSEEKTNFKRSFADGLKLFRKKSSYHSHRFLACVQREHRCNDETISRQMGGP
ncbi:uncharacterized protein LOC134240630 [Saccostrea cucullata]|uniref:uncharacterized protein LOC134240630 n=1 Tax=Saccostrea cuccullata TaxID=36930 RepID=UPI002ED3EA57